ncbi:MAG: hypothetical protein GC200_03020 [Tepidisphaera sp.]|nr:hypothetical protein [Tepidisphaera sp.]
MTTNANSLSGPFPLSPRERWPSTPWRRLSLWLSRETLNTLATTGELLNAISETAHLPLDLGEVREGLSLWHDRRAWPERGLHVGIHNPGAWSDRVIEAPGVVDVRFFAVLHTDPQEALRDARFDALLSHENGEVVIRTPEHPGKEASWYDWGAPRPVSFASILPGRIDAARASLAEGAGEPHLVRLLTELAAVLSRHEMRLTFEDRLHGRRPIRFTRDATRNGQEVRPTRDLVSMLAQRLEDELSRRSGNEGQSGVVRAAARVVSAWAAGWPTESADEQSRREAAETAARLAGDEPEVLLRAAYLRLCDCDTRAGLAAIEKASRGLVTNSGADACDPQAFLNAELDRSTPGTHTSARLAVCVALVAATTPADSLAYFRDDLSDDLKHSKALHGREGDEKLIMDAFRAVDRAQREVARRAA